LFYHQVVEEAVRALFATGEDFYFPFDRQMGKEVVD